MDLAAAFVIRRGRGGFIVENSKRLAVGEAGGALDYAFRETRFADFAVFVEVDEGGEGEALDVGLERADAVAEMLGQHGDDAVGEIRCEVIATFARFAVEGMAGANVMGDIGDMDGEAPAAAREALDVDGVVEILGVIGIDGDDELLPAIFAPGYLGRFDVLREAAGVAFHGLRKGLRKLILADDGKSMFHAGSVGRAEDFDNLAFGIDVPRFPLFEAHGRPLSPTRAPRKPKLHVDVILQAWIVGDDVRKLLRGLEGADDGGVVALEDFDDPRFAREPGRCSRPSCMSRATTLSPFMAVPRFGAEMKTSFTPGVSLRRWALPPACTCKVPVTRSAVCGRT